MDPSSSIHLRFSVASCLIKFHLMATNSDSQPTLIQLLWRAVRLRCPKCGESPIFRGWFGMHEHCATCGRKFNRDPGYLLGSIYFNYGITATLVVAAYFAIYFSEVFSHQVGLGILSVFCLVFPLWFFRYARSLWIAFDEKFDPWPNEEEMRE